MSLNTKEYDEIFKELCRRVGAPYPPKVPLQVTDYHWTVAEEADFRKWLIKYLKTHRYYKGMNQKYIESAVDFFMLDYSWSYKDDEKK